MVTIRLSSSSSKLCASPCKIREEKHRKVACVTAVISGIATILAEVSPHLDKKPMHTSALTGQMWVNGLLKGIQTLQINLFQNGIYAEYFGIQ